LPEVYVNRYALNMFESDPPTITKPFRDIYTISRLNRETRSLLEGSFPLLWIEGEISNLARPASGHFYFSLKDENAQVRCAMFRNRNMNLGFTPENGMQVLVRAKVGLYEARGEFQMLIEHMEESGDGALQRAFEQLKHKLDNEGLFAAQHKKELPALPRQIGIITSPTGAAVHDVLTTLQRRFASLPVVIYPVPVQGKDAAEQIANMIKIADSRNECDVLLLCRGGGSLEDLWSFNEEVVARAIYQCQIPIITGIGHEIDFTIADFVADHRAPTPTGAAEVISPDKQEWLTRLSHLQHRLYSNIKNSFSRKQQQFAGLQKRLQHPGRRLMDMNQRLDELESRLGRACKVSIDRRLSQLEHTQERLLRHSPLHRIQVLQTRNQNNSRRLSTSMQHLLNQFQNRFKQATHGLDAVSPLATLDRGYSIISDEKRQIIRQASQTKKGAQIKARLAEGQLYCQVTEVIESNE